MKRVLLFIPSLVCAVAIVVIAAPLLRLFRPIPTKRETMSVHVEDLADYHELTNTLASVLDAAGVPTADQGEPIDLLGRVRWLAQVCDDKERHANILHDDLTVETSRANELSKNLYNETSRANAAEVNLSELHIRIRQVLGAESVAEALEEAGALKTKCDELAKDRQFVDELRKMAETDLTDALKDVAYFRKQATDALHDGNTIAEQRDAEIAGIMKQRDEALSKMRTVADDAGALATENLRLERLVKTFAAKVKRREADIERYRVEIAKPARAKSKPKTRKRA